MTAPQCSLVVPSRDRLGESPVWRNAEQAIYWVDWYGQIIHRLHVPSGTLDHWTVPGTTMIGSLVLARGGSLLLAIDSGLQFFDPVAGRFELLADPNEGREGVSYNDAKVDRFGRYWVGTFDTSETEPRGVLYCVTGADKWTVADSGFVVCNGPAFSPSGLTLYFCDSIGRRILAYDVSPGSAHLHNRRVFARFGEGDGIPDGLTVDAKGDIWCAHYGASRITRFGSDGRIRQTLTLPCEAVTSCCFGGPDLMTLYVTTGISESDSRPGVGGGLFAFELDVQGLPEHEF